jgi:hypothetical protein
LSVVQPSATGPTSAEPGPGEEGPGQNGISVSQLEELAMFQHETAENDRFEKMILEAVRQVLASKGLDQFFDWART